MKMIRSLFMITTVLVLAGCASSPTSVSLIPETDGTPYSERQDALGTLLNEALQAQTAGQLSEAEGWLTRAMRIGPTSPEVYYQFALLRQKQGQVEQAQQLAGRALSLGPNRSLERQIKQLIKRL